MLRLLVVVQLLVVLMVMQVGVAVVEPVGSHAGRLLVLVQVAAQRERLAAPAADVRLVGGVGLDVRAQVGLVGERLAAVRAAKRLLARVSSDVSLEQPRPGEALAALGTLAALAVRPNVHAVRRRRRVHLVAVRTLARRRRRRGGRDRCPRPRPRPRRRVDSTVWRRAAPLLLLVTTLSADDGRAMTLAVSGQVAGGAVGPAALRARVHRRRRRRRCPDRHVDPRSHRSRRRRLCRPGHGGGVQRAELQRRRQCRRGTVEMHLLLVMTLQQDAVNQRQQQTLLRRRRALPVVKRKRQVGGGRPVQLRLAVVAVGEPAALVRFLT